MSDWIKKQYKDAKPFLIGGILIFTHAFFMVGGADIATRNASDEKDLAVEHAIATFEPSPLNCDDQNAIRAIKSLAENGAHISEFNIDVFWDYKDEQDGQ